jgi:hypothetical protein
MEVFMSTFQLAALGLFLVALVINYGQQIRNTVRALVSYVNRHPAAPVAPSPAPAETPVVQQSTAYTVNDLVTVTALRDRLSAVGCVEGVDACKMLIRIMIEFKLS